METRGKDMGTRVLKIDIPADILTALNENDKELGSEMKLHTAIHFYRSGKLTLGKAARMADMEKYDFELLLSKNSIPISNLDQEDIDLDIKKLSKL
jgi:predicted HTH domain antitoxin